ncbi:gastrin/cholecystokinin type B receptor isoform X1 [Passer montanus]|uniref:gastrin/cholecystokinin type B receptor isoform X1 n=1 Tax=Passer montanus TaxID=9160 RepID=UPI0019608D33|nr:gastrin/cholecystokinin type B receptor isoform X1 [Passer montanus]
MGLHRARAGHVGALVSRCLGLCWGAFGCLRSASGGPPGYPRGALAVSLWRPRECFQSAPGVPRGGSAAPCPAARRAGRGGAGGALRADLRAERRGQRAGGGRAGAEPAAAHRHQLLPAVPGPERPAPGAVLHALHPAARPHGRLRLRRRRLQARGLPHGGLGGRVHLQPGGHRPRALQCHLQPAAVARLADAVPRVPRHRGHLGAGGAADAALRRVQHHAARRPPPAPRTVHPPLAQRARPAGLVSAGTERERGPGGTPADGATCPRYVLLLLVLFFIPGVVMTVAYGLISRELYRGIRFELDIKGDVAAQRGPGGDPAPACDEGDGCYLQLSRPSAALELRALGAQQDRARINSSGAQLAAKRRVIRMLVVIVAMFFLCWLPIFAANTWRAFAPRAAQRALSGTPIAFIHLLSYTSACANPLIYCFMNRRFRKAFGATCAGWGCRRACPRRPPEDEPPMASASLSKFSYTTVSSLGPP